MRYRNLFLTGLLITAGLLLGACGSKSAEVSKVEPAKVEEIEGSEFKRVVLTEKAAERIGIQTAAVGEGQAMRTRRVGGRVADSASTLPDTGSENANLSQVWVQVRLSQSDLNSVDRSQPARVLSLGGDDEDNDDLTAEPDEGPGLDDGEDSGDQDDDTLYYRVDNRDSRLVPAQSVLVELPLAADSAPRLVVPYAALIYGLEGETWVYTNPELLVFVREPVVVDYIEGDQAILTEGPSTGAMIVTVGVAELFGAETGVSK
jgi:hypothetical protein